MDNVIFIVSSKTGRGWVRVNSKLLNVFWKNKNKDVNNEWAIVGIQQWTKIPEIKDNETKEHYSYALTCRWCWAARKTMFLNVVSAASKQIKRYRVAEACQQIMPHNQKNVVSCVHIPNILNGVSYFCISNICTQRGIFIVNKLAFLRDRHVLSPKLHILKSCSVSVSMTCTCRLRLWGGQCWAEIKTSPAQCFVHNIKWKQKSSLFGGGFFKIYIAICIFALKINCSKRSAKRREVLLLVIYSKVQFLRIDNSLLKVKPVVWIDPNCS